MRMEEMHVLTIVRERQNWTLLLQGKEFIIQNYGKLLGELRVNVEYLSMKPRIGQQRQRREEPIVRVYGGMAQMVGNYLVPHRGRLMKSIKKAKMNILNITEADREVQNDRVQ